MKTKIFEVMASVLAVPHTCANDLTTAASLRRLLGCCVLVTSLSLYAAADFEVELPAGTNLAVGATICFGSIMPERYVDPASQTQAADHSFTVTFTNIPQSAYMTYMIERSSSQSGFWLQLFAPGLAPDAAGVVRFHDPGPQFVAFYRLVIQTDMSRVFTIRNTGTTVLTNIALTVAGTNAASFELSLSGTASLLSPGASTTFAVTYLAWDTNVRTAELRVTSDGLGPFNLFLIGGDACMSVNHVPVVANAIPDTNAFYGTPFSFAFATNAFTDPDADQTLTYSASVPPDFTFTPATRTISGVSTYLGTFPIVVTATDNGTPPLSTNDVFNIIVTNAPLLVVADDQSRRYGTNNPPLTISYSGFVLGETNTVLDIPPTADTLASSGSPVGVYPITPSGGADDHYSFIYSNGTLSVTPAPLSITASNATRLYGEAPPYFIGNIAGEKNGDIFYLTFNCPANFFSPVGTFPIVPEVHDNGNRLGNYTITTNEGTLTITPALLTVTAFNASCTFGAPIPALTGTLVGLRNGDNITANFTTPATNGSLPGQFPITASLNDPGGTLGNYSVTTNHATLTIDQPAMAVFNTNQFLAITWPGVPTNSLLLVATNFHPPVIWHDVTFGITEANGTKLFVVTNDLREAGRMFRVEFPWPP